MTLHTTAGCSKMNQSPGGLGGHSDAFVPNFARSWPTQRVPWRKWLATFAAFFPQGHQRLGVDLRRGWASDRLQFQLAPGVSNAFFKARLEPIEKGLSGIRGHHWIFLQPTFISRSCVCFQLFSELSELRLLWPPKVVLLVLAIDVEHVKPLWDRDMEINYPRTTRFPLPRFGSGLRVFRNPLRLASHHRRLGSPSSAR